MLSEMGGKVGLEVLHGGFCMAASEFICSFEIERLV